MRFLFLNASAALLFLTYTLNLVDSRKKKWSGLPVRKAAGVWQRQSTLGEGMQ